LPLRDEIVGGYNTYEPSRDQSEYDRYKSWNFGPHFHGSPTMWRYSDARAWIYEWAEKDTLKKYEFDLASGRFVRGAAHPWVAQGDVGATNCGAAFLLCIDAMPGGMLALSANGRDRSSGIVWAILRGGVHEMSASGIASSLPAGDALYAFDAQSMRRLWSQRIWSVPRFAGPTVADGRVLVPSNFWVFSVYVLNDVPAANNGAAARVRAAAVTAQPPAPAPPVPAWGAMAMEHRPVADYAADPMFRARQALPALFAGRDAGGVIPGAQYIANGTEHYTCPAPPANAACVWTRTEASLTPLAVAPGHVAAAAPAAASPVTVAIDPQSYHVRTFPWPRAAGWQVIEPGSTPLSGPFANAVFVLRTMTVNGAPPATLPGAGGDVAVPFTALYSAFVQGK
jgi:hypothetical protein